MGFWTTQTYSPVGCGAAEEAEREAAAEAEMAALEAAELANVEEAMTQEDL